MTQPTVETETVSLSSNLKKACENANIAKAGLDALRVAAEAAFMEHKSQ